MNSNIFAQNCLFFIGAAISYAAHALAIGFANTLALFYQG